jgi:hypothetical protein
MIQDTPSLVCPDNRSTFVCDSVAPRLNGVSIPCSRQRIANHDGGNLSCIITDCPLLNLFFALAHALPTRDERDRVRYHHQMTVPQDVLSGIETAMQYLVWALEEIDKSGNEEAARYARNALDALRQVAQRSSRKD